LTFHYIGSELALFATARNWKLYLSSQVSPYVGRRVLEVGAGIGTNTNYLFHEKVECWVAMEPDPLLAGQIDTRIGNGQLSRRCEVVVGAIDSLEPLDLFDTILYLDVLEHISDDQGELARAAKHLTTAGHLVIVAPAHQFLFSAFDQSIGHYRRYNARMMQSISPDGCRLVGIWFLDSLGFFASLANRVALRSSAPSANQIAFWDQKLVQISRLTDWLTRYKFGKTVVSVWVRD
jgi:SAM-dependent methyltransferase